MFKTQVVDSRNFRKTITFKILRILLIPILLFLVAISLRLFGKDSAIETFLHNNQTTVMQPLAIAIMMIAVAMSLIMKSRMKNPRLLGIIEMDDNGFRYLVNDKIEYTEHWRETSFILLEFYSTTNRNNPTGCMNYLTIVDQNGLKNFEIVVENSLMKADLGELLRQINQKVPIKVRYTIPIKKIIGDKDLKV